MFLTVWLRGPPRVSWYATTDGGVTFGHVTEQQQQIAPCIDARVGVWESL